MLPMRGGRDRIPSIVEMSGEADMVRGNAKQRMAKNSTREDPHCQKCYLTEKLRHPCKQD